MNANIPRQGSASAAAGLATAGLDPLLIFGFGLGPDGAAIAIVLARIIIIAIGFHGCVSVHDMIDRPRLSFIRQDAARTFAVTDEGVHF